MTTEKQNAIASCFLMALGLFFGVVVYIMLYGRWISSDAVSTIAYFVDKVLLNALLISIFWGALASILVYPFQYYYMKRLAVMNRWAYCLFGFVAVFILLSYVKVRF